MLLHILQICNCNSELCSKAKRHVSVIVVHFLGIVDNSTLESRHPPLCPYHTYPQLYPYRLVYLVIIACSVLCRNIYALKPRRNL
jgi:hypothetical protein